MVRGNQSDTGRHAEQRRKRDRAVARPDHAALPRQGARAMTENDSSAQPAVSRRRLMTMGSAALAGAGIAALDRRALAQDATPAASPPAGHGHGMATPEPGAPASTPTPFNGVTGEPLA